MNYNDCLGDMFVCTYPYELRNGEMSELDVRCRLTGVSDGGETLFLEREYYGTRVRVEFAVVDDDTLIFVQDDGESEHHELIEIHQEGAADVMLNHDLPDYTESYQDNIADVASAINRANVHIGQVMQQTDADCIAYSDAFMSAEAYESDVQTLIDGHNKYAQGVEDRPTVTFPSESYALLWVTEICGQISDGAWENHDVPWELYNAAIVEVDESLTDVEFDSRLPRLDYASRLAEHDGLMGRMLFHLLASGIDERATVGDVEWILHKMQNHS